MVDGRNLKPPKYQLSHERLLEVLTYAPDTGEFTWRKRISIRIRVGATAGSKTQDGYVEIGLDGHNYLAHVLAWFYVTGQWPNGQIDHRDTDKSNTRFANLREATHGQNVQNSGLRQNNTSGFKGVSWIAKKSRWHARIMADGQLFILGDFSNPQEAHAAYVAKAKEVHGEFARVA